MLLCKKETDENVKILFDNIRRENLSWLSLLAKEIFFFFSLMLAAKKQNILFSHRFIIFVTTWSEAAKIVEEGFGKKKIVQQRNNLLFLRLKRSFLIMITESNSRQGFVWEEGKKKMDFLIPFKDGKKYSRKSLGFDFFFFFCYANSNH